jgi:hypothetical protein
MYYLQHMVGTKIVTPYIAFKHGRPLFNKFRYSDHNVPLHLADIKYLLNVAIFCDIEPCGQYVNRRFGGTCHIHLQGKKSAEQETSHLLQARFLLGRILTLKTEAIRSSETSVQYELHGAISQKMATFLTSAVTTSYPKYLYVYGHVSLRV